MSEQDQAVEVGTMLRTDAEECPEQYQVVPGLVYDRDDSIECEQCQRAHRVIWALEVDLVAIDHH